MASDERVARLLQMAASLEEAIIRLEQQSHTEETIIRLRVMQGEILSAVHHLKGDFPAVD